MRFDDHYMTPQVRWRGYCIAHAVADTLKNQESRRIIELGCHKGQNCLDIARILLATEFTGVDHVNYKPALVVKMEFICDNIDRFIQMTDKHWDLTLCAWILVHLRYPEKDAFWEKLAKLSTYLVTYENEVQQDRDFGVWFERYGLEQIRHDTFHVLENTYELRVFRRDN